VKGALRPINAKNVIYEKSTEKGEKKSRIISKGKKNRKVKRKT